MYFTEIEIITGMGLSLCVCGYERMNKLGSVCVHTYIDMTLEYIHTKCDSIYHTLSFTFTPLTDTMMSLKSIPTTN